MTKHYYQNNPILEALYKDYDKLTPEQKLVLDLKFVKHYALYTIYAFLVALNGRLLLRSNFRKGGKE